MIKTESVFKRVKSKWFKSFHIHKELHKLLTFYDKFDIEGQEEEEEEIFIYTGYYLQLELIFKATLLKQINITYIHKEKQDSGIRHTNKSS